ncbi:MAG: aldo/keto reductase family oxidoreductase [Ruminococcaceae bacterium]|nr:aldo/keto reductase family oxidoreductase [Oscillospiraceae bacterium]
MKQTEIGKNGFSASEIILGCMRINKLNVDEVKHLLTFANDRGIDIFDHSDIYAGGICEELFGRALNELPGFRDKIKIQTKCGIVHDSKGTIAAFDFSKKHIIESVEQSLRRMNTDRIDSLLLHRPDTLMEPEEVAEAFEYLYDKGMVLNFGVSNQNPGQIELLKTCVKQPLTMNQMQLSIVECGMIAQGLNTNMSNKLSYMHDAGVLDYSRINGMTIQAWSPFQKGFFEGSFIDDPEYKTLNDKLEEIGGRYNVSKTAVATAWILRHPARMQVLVGTTNVRHLRDILGYEKVELSREDWYSLYRAAGHTLP